MLFCDRFMLPRENQQDVDASWFDKQKQHRVQNNDLTLRGWLAQQVDALRAFHDGLATVEEAAFYMTSPISTSPVRDLGGYSDEILAVNTLWQLIIAALVDWPSARTPDLFVLLGAIAKVTDKIHRGQATDDDAEPLTWNELPYFALSWPDDLQPGQICRQCPNEASLASARRLYLRIKDLEAQLLAKHIMRLSKRVIQYTIRALEKDIDDGDKQIARDEATAYHQVKLNFHIPAISYLFMYNGHEIYEQVVRDELRDWTPGQMPDEAKAFNSGIERWSFWKQRLVDLIREDANNEIKATAEATLRSMTLCEGE